MGVGRFHRTAEPTKPKPRSGDATHMEGEVCFEQFFEYNCSNLVASITAVKQGNANV